MLRPGSFLLFPVLLLCTLVAGLQVTVEYSFRLPEVFGVATPESANCCLYGHLPDNNTDGMTPPTIFGIGVQKGGTTTLYDHFRVHPQLVGAKKELHYLDEGKNKSYARYLRSWKWNREPQRSVIETGNSIQFRAVAPRVGGLFEISPSYMFVPFAACKAKIISPNGKFIVFLRDPTSRAYSGLSYTIHVMRRRQGAAPWMQEGFWTLMRRGLIDIGSNPLCDFQTGRGVYSYNDCMGCVLRRVDLQRNCGRRPFVNFTEGSYKCTFVGTEHIIRGLYGPQLAWWFTLLDPSQFKIVNSDRFFQSPLEVMKEIGEFLELQPGYTSAMLKKSKVKANVGVYRKENPKLVAFAKKVLREFYRRPNLELYRLLEETGHTDFIPFEKELHSYQTLDCSDAATVETGICGDPRFHAATRKEEFAGSLLPILVTRAVHVVEAEDPEADAEDIVTEVQSLKPKTEVGSFDTTAKPGTSTNDGVPTVQSATASRENLPKGAGADIQRSGRVEVAAAVETEDDIVANISTERGTPTRGDATTAATADGRNETTAADEATTVVGKDGSIETAHESPSQSLLRETENGGGLQAAPGERRQERGDVQNAEDSGVSDELMFDAAESFDRHPSVARHTATQGMIRADRFMHVAFAVALTAMLLFGYRWMQQRSRRASRVLTQTHRDH